MLGAHSFGNSRDPLRSSGSADLGEACLSLRHRAGTAWARKSAHAGRTPPQEKLRSAKTPLSGSSRQHRADWRRVMGDGVIDTPESPRVRVLP